MATNQIEKAIHEIGKASKYIEQFTKNVKNIENNKNNYSGNTNSKIREIIKTQWSAYHKIQSISVELDNNKKKVETLEKKISSLETVKTKNKTLEKKINALEKRLSELELETQNKNKQENITSIEDKELRELGFKKTQISKYILDKLNRINECCTVKTKLVVIEELFKYMLEPEVRKFIEYYDNFKTQLKLKMIEIYNQEPSRYIYTTYRTIFNERIVINTTNLF